ncbi:MAG: hypothetical protein ACHBN1_31700 [Heteroscytonema crispum UTEX LB 1556]
MSAVLAQNFIHSSQSSVVQSNSSSSSDGNSQSSVVQSSSSSSNDMDDFSSFSSSQQSSYSSGAGGYQRSTLNLSAVNLNQPHILKISSPGAQLNGEITLNGKVIQRIHSNQVEINLSPLLSVGEQKVEIAASYSPPSSGVSVELDGLGTNVVQQTSGNGVLNYVMTVNVQ